MDMRYGLCSCPKDWTGLLVACRSLAEPVAGCGPVVVTAAPAGPPESGTRLLLGSGSWAGEVMSQV